MTYDRVRDVLALGCLTLFATACPYEAVDLGTLPGGGESAAVAINDGGDIVGWSTNHLGERRPVLWRNDFFGYQIVDLGLCGGVECVVSDINAHGDLAGYRTMAGGETRAFTIWSGAFYDLGLGRASEINDSRWIIGRTGPADYERLAIWKNSLTPSLLPNVEAQLGGPKDLVGINDVSQVAVVSYPQGSVYRWQNGALTNPQPCLPSIGFPDERAFAIDDSGGIAGRCTILHAPNQPRTVAAYWRTQNATPSVIADRAGSVALSSNGAGGLAGYDAATDGSRVPIHWVPASDFVQELPTLGGAEGQANAIAEGGEIVGWSENAYGQRRATLWRRPEPEGPPSYGPAPDLEIEFDPTIPEYLPIDPEGPVVRELSEPQIGLAPLPIEELDERGIEPVLADVLQEETGARRIQELAPRIP